MVEGVTAVTLSVVFWGIIVVQEALSETAMLLVLSMVELVIVTLSVVLWGGGGMISSSSSTLSVNNPVTTGNNFVGGLVGSSFGIIQSSYVLLGNVSAGAGASVGGLLGDNSGTGSIVRNSYATGLVDGGAGDRDFVGGLVGAVSDGNYHRKQLCYWGCQWWSW